MRGLQLLLAGFYTLVVGIALAASVRTFAAPSPSSPLSQGAPTDTPSIVATAPATPTGAPRSPTIFPAATPVPSFVATVFPTTTRAPSLVAAPTAPSPALPGTGGGGGRSRGLGTWPIAELITGTMVLMAGCFARWRIRRR